MSTRRYQPSNGFEFTKPSLTVPGQVLSLKTILTRFRKGQGVQVFEGVYNPDFPPEFDKMDKLDRMDAAREMSRTVAHMRRKLSEPEPEPEPVPEPVPVPEPKPKSVVEATKD